MAAALQRHAVVRCPEKDQITQARPPDLGRLHCVVARAARHQPAHAVADDGELLDRHRPLLDEDVEHLGKGAAVSRDMQSSVVVEIERRVAEVASQGGAVIVPPSGSTAGR